MGSFLRRQGSNCIYENQSWKLIKLFRFRLSVRNDHETPTGLISYIELTLFI